VTQAWLVSTAGADDLADGCDPLLLSQHVENDIAPFLVAADQVPDRSRDVSDRRLLAGAADPERPLFGDGSEQLLLRPEAPHHCSNGDSGAGRHVVKRDLVVQLLPEQLLRRRQDPFTVGLCRFGPRGHSVVPLRTGLTCSHFMSC